jgi:hypothetical protein
VFTWTKDAISRFRRILKITRLSVRRQTHTLRLPPARSEIYGGPKTSWLRDLLEYLPNLQALLVSGLPFFDHGALMALRGFQGVGYDDDAGIGVGVGVGLRLLRADREPNTTSTGLVEALGHFRNLVYLDLSYTATAKDPVVLKALALLGDLLVLKMRGVRMRDQGVEVLTSSIGVRVRVLDLRDNLVTDDGVRSLIDGSVVAADGGGGDEDQGGGIRLGPEESILSAESLRSEDLDGRIVEQLRQPYSRHPAFEYLPHAGVTHLMVAGNRLTADGLARLLESKRMNVLDAGSVDVEESGSEMSSSAGRLIPILVTSAAKSLTYLRVSHSVVTEDAHIMDVSGSRHLATNQISGRRDAEPYPIPPETKHTYSLQQSRINLLLAKRPRTSTIFQRNSKDRSLHLHPSHLPNLKTLVLTDIPSSAPSSSHLIPSLINFITSCADESLLSTLQSQSNYSLPPGLFRENAERQHARSLFALQRIILEITPAATAEPKRKLSRVPTGGWNSEYYHNPGFLKSSTGDEDGERLFAAAANDFSFFGDGDDGGEEEIYPQKRARNPNREPETESEKGPWVDVVSALAEFRRAKRREFEELVVREGGSVPTTPSTTATLGSGLVVGVEGHWGGEVKIVRNA